MRRASTLPVLLAAAGGLLLAGAASAQSGPPSTEPTHGLRYMSWPGRGEARSPDNRAPAQTVPVRRDLRRPNPVIPHGGEAAPAPTAGLTPAPGPTRRGLTPANAWLQPAAPPPPAPPPATAPAVEAAPAAPAPAPRPRPVPEYLPDRGGRGQPAPAEVVYPTPVPAPDAGVDRSADPMAPRADAPIFRMQQTAPASTPETPSARSEATPARVDPQAAPRRVMEVANSGERPPQQGARYYSVHRQNGRTPDAVVVPEPTYVDALVVSMVETPASQDLAAPEQGPTLIRDRNGNMRAAPAASDGDHQ